MSFLKSRFAGLLLVAVAAIAASPASAQTDVKAIVLKHLKTSRDFTLKVAAQMPDSSYDFKLTPPQMSFAGQMIHLSQSMSAFISPLSGQATKPAQPASMSKKDVIAFMTKAQIVASTPSLSAAELIAPGSLAK